MKSTPKSFLLTLILIFCALALCSCAGAKVAEGEAVALISDSGDEVTVTAAFKEQVQNANKDKTVYLFKLGTGTVNYDLTALAPVAEAKMGASVSFTLPLRENGSSALTCAFLMATKDPMNNSYAVLTGDPIYISNPEKLASNTSGAEKYSSIKGVNAESADLAISLGASHAVVDLPIEKYLAQKGGDGTVRRDFDGVSYFFDLSAISKLDRKISALTDAGTAVYLRVYLGSAYEELPDQQKFLSYPNTEKGGKYYNINVGSKDAVNAFAAFTDLLASRYAVGGEHGFAGSLIVGKAQNSSDLGDEQAKLASGAFAKEYAVSLRLAHNIMRSYFSGAQVYLAIDNRLTSVRSASHLSADAFISAVDAEFDGASDFCWGVAAECGAATVTGDRVWYDTENNSLITPTNLSGLTDTLLGREDLLYSDWVRPVIISDLAIASVRDSLASESNQAVSYAFTYYEAVKNGKISALIYSELYDNESSTFGLIGGSGEKEICSIFRKVDTENDISDTVGELIGAPWNVLADNKELCDKVRRGKYSTGTGSLGSSDGYELSSLFSFDGGTLCGFDTLGGGYTGLKRENGSSRLFAEFDPSGGEKHFSIASFGVPSELVGGDYIVIPLKIMPNGDAAVGSYKLTLTLIQNEREGEVRNYSSSVSVTPSSDCTAVFDISDFTADKLGSDIAFMLTVETADTIPFTLSVSEVLSAKEPASNIWIAVLIIVGILVLGALIVVFVLWFRKNYTIDLGTKKNKKHAADGN